jgi:hypothetical protein
MGDDVPDGQQEGSPVLIERDDGDHHEEVEVQLDVATGQVHQQRRRRDEAEATDRGAHPPADRRPTRHGGNRRQDCPLGEAVRQPPVGDHPEEHDADGV